MSDESFDEVSEILKYIMENPSVPRNIRRAADESYNTLNDDSEDPTVRASAVILKMKSAMTQIFLSMQEP